MIIKNNTHYFGEYSKIFNAFPDPDSFSFESSKRMGYFQRLWFEYAYTRSVRGIVFYYTLTYNDLHIPKFYGKNCFSYKDIRYITNGKLSKVLLRKYGSRLRYFCACESGEGGTEEHHVRGLGNNPHYHFIFFVQPIHDKEGKPVYDSFRCITSQEFKDLIYELWQGQDSRRYTNWMFAKYGHCQEGKYNGEVLSAEAFSYVGKYCVKDLSEKAYEQELCNIFRAEVLETDISNVVLYQYYKFLKSTDFGCPDKYEFFKYFKLHEYNEFRKSSPTLVDRSLERYYFDYCGSVGQMLIWQITTWFKDVFVEQYVQERLSEYRNLYSGKCRMSKSLGEYGINFIEDKSSNPRVKLNLSSGYQIQYPCLYYIRKLYYDVKKCPITGNPLYYLNDLGIKVKLNSLKNNIKQYEQKVHEYLSYYYHQSVSVSKSDSDLDANYILDSHLEHFLPEEYYDHPLRLKNSDITQESFFHNNINEIVRRYSVYHYVYQHRNFSDIFGVQLDELCTESAYMVDYHKFLLYNSYYLDFEDGTVYDMVYRSGTMKSFINHEAFSKYRRYFEFLDLLVSQVSLIFSDNSKERFKTKSDYQKRQNQYKFNSASFEREQIVFCE